MPQVSEAARRTSSLRARTIRARRLPFLLTLAFVIFGLGAAPPVRGAKGSPGGEPTRPYWDAAERNWKEPPIPCTSERAVTLGRDLDGDGDPDEIDLHLEVVEVQEEVYPGKFERFWVFAPEGAGMCSPARVPSPTIRVEEGDHVRIFLHNTHYFPHTIHFHGTIHPNAMDGVPEITQAPVLPGQTFVYEFTARTPGTFWYHCHVQPDVHVLMGLAGMFIIEPNRPRNLFRHIVVGAGRIPDLARGTAERYQREYSLVYMDIDDRLNAIPATADDPREIERRMHREYDATRRQPNSVLLNAGARMINLHVHGHHPIIIAADGYSLPPAARVARDVFTLGAAQRLDLELRPGSDDRYAAGPGVWLVHDHTEQATTNNGINPGGDLTVVVYESFKGQDGLPKVATDLGRFFDPGYYRGQIPVFDPAIFHTTREQYREGRAPETRGEGPPSYPLRKETRGTTSPGDLQQELAEHRIAATSCAKPRSRRRVVMREGTAEAQAGEVYGFEPRMIHADRCEEVTVVLENTDSVRHNLMIPGLDPMFTFEFRGPGVRTARFVTPDEDVTLPFHCHVPGHETMGMHGELVVGQGGAPRELASDSAQHFYEGEGTVVSVDMRKSRIVVNHGEIPGFMAAMTNMSFLVTRPSLLEHLHAGEKVRFTIDADQRAIVNIGKTPD